MELDIQQIIERMGRELAAMTARAVIAETARDQLLATQNAAMQATTEQTGDEPRQD